MGLCNEYRIDRSVHDPSVYRGILMSKCLPNEPSWFLQTLFTKLRPRLHELWDNREKVPYEVRYVQKYRDGSDGLYKYSFHFPHLGSRYWLKVTDCTAQWFHQAVEPSPYQKSRKQIIEPHKYVQHDFFAEDLVCMDGQTDYILSEIEEVIRICKYRKCHNQCKRYSLRIYLEYLLNKTNNDAGLKFMKIYTCRGKDLRGVFEMLCGQKLERGFSLSAIANFVPRPCAIKGDIHIPSGQIEENFCREWQMKPPEGQYFDLMNTHWYNLRQSAGSDSVGDANWVSIHDTDVRLMCSPFWPDQITIKEEDEEEGWGESYQPNSPQINPEENLRFSYPYIIMGYSSWSSHLRSPSHD